MLLGDRWRWIYGRISSHRSVLHIQGPREGRRLPPQKSFQIRPELKSVTCEQEILLDAALKMTAVCLGHPAPTKHATV